MAKTPRHGLQPQAKSPLAPPSLRNGRKARPAQTRRKSRFEQLEDRRVLAAFTAGDIAVVRTGITGGTPLAGGTTASTFIDEYTPAGVLVQSIALPTSDTTSNGVTEHALTVTSSATSEGELNLSTNGQYLTLVGYDTAPGYNDGGLGASSSSSSVINRTVGEIGVNGSVNTTTALTDFANKNNPRAAFTTDGSSVWLAGADSSTGGIRYISSLGNNVTTSANLTAGNLKNARDVEVFNGQVYFSTSKEPKGGTVNDSIDALGSGEPTSGTQTMTGVTGATVGTNGTSSKPNAFFFARVGSGTSYNGYDTLYIADGSQTTPPLGSGLSTPGISKYTYNGSTWAYDGSIDTSDDIEGLTGVVTGSTVVLYATSSNPAGTTSEIESVTDNSGFAGSITNGGSSTPTLVVSAPSNEFFHGVALAPQLANVDFVVSTAASTTAGQSQTVTVTAQYATGPMAGQTDTNYTGTVAFTSTDPQATPGNGLPTNYTFLNSNAGVKTFNVTLKTAGSQTITVTDTGSGGFGTAGVSVSAANLHQLAVSAPVDATAGIAFSVTVTAQDAYGNTITGYTGTVSFSGSAGATFPGTYNFVSGDNGSHTFTNGVTLTAGSATGSNQTILATDSGNSVSGSATVDDFIVSAFTAGDFVVYRVGTGGAANISGSSAPVLLDEYTPSGTLVESVPMPVTSTSGGNQALTGAGNATSEGELSLSPNGEYLALTGYDTGVGYPVVSNSQSTVVPRTVAIVGPSGSVNSTTALTDFSNADNVRSAVTTDGTNIWVAGNSGGVAYTTVGSTTSTPIDPSSEQNVRQLQIFDGQLYVSSQKSVTLATVGSGTPVTASQVLTNLAGVAGNGELANGFFFAQLNPSSGGPDTLYLTDSAGVDGNGLGDVEKYSLISGSWTYEGEFNAAGVTGLTGSVNGSTITLYATTSTSSGEAGTVYKFTDSSGLGGFISGAASTIVTAPSNEAFRGVALVPQTPATTATHFAVSVQPSSVVAGTPFNFTITAENASNAPVTNYSGTVNFYTTDPNTGAVVPAQYTFNGTQNGTATLSATLITAGTQTITAGGTIFGTSNNITVDPAAASTYTLSAPANTTAGIAFSVTVSVYDQYGNLATNYTGTTHFSGGGAGATLPANYTFTNTDAGTHTFTNAVTLAAGAPTGGDETITATDTTASPTVTGSVTVDDYVVSAFTAGDLVIDRIGDGSAALTSSGTQVFLDEYSPTGTLVESVPMPGVSNVGGNQALVSSGTATSEGELNLSSNGAYLVLTGYDTPIGTASVSGTDSTSVPRTIGVVSATGSVNTTTALTDFATASNPRSADTTNGTSLWIAGGAGGVAYTTLGSTTSTPLDASGEQNVRDLQIFNGQLYVSSQKSLTLGTVGTGEPTTGGQSLTNLPGLPASGATLAANAYFFANLSGVGTAPDTLYITDTASNSGAGQIDKYSLESGTWVATGSIAVGPEVTGVTGSVSSGIVTLYATASGSSSTSGMLYKATDSTGFQGTVSGTASLIATAANAGNEAFRGIAFAPTAIATISPPVVSTSGSTGQTYTLGGSAVAVDSGISVTSSDTDITGASETIANYQSGDALNYTPIDGITIASNSGGVLTLTGSATPAQYTAALQSVTFSTTSINQSTRTIDVVADDSAASPTTSNTGVDTVKVAIAPPVVTANQTAKASTAGQTVAVDSAVTVKSFDTDVTGATMTIGTGYQSGSDTLHFTTQNGITGVYSAGVLTLSGSATPAQYQTALQSVTFSSTSTSVATRNISIVVDDSGDTGNVNSNTATTQITVSAPLTVTAAYISSTSWASSFDTYLSSHTNAVTGHAYGSSTLGYAFQTGTSAAQTQTLPWTNLNTITVTFSGPVSGVALGSLKLNGGSGGSTPSVTGFTSDGSNTYSWTLSGPLTNNKYAFGIASTSSSYGPAVVDSHGAGISGTFTTGQALPSGNGLAGSSFDFFFDVLPGDANRDAQDNATDINDIRPLASGTRTTSSSYNPYYDLLGAGQINATTLNTVRALTGRLESAAPTNPNSTQGVGTTGFVGLELGAQETGSSSSSSPASTVSNVVSAPASTTTTTTTTTSTTGSGSGGTSSTTGNRDHGRHAATDEVVSDFDLADLYV